MATSVRRGWGKLGSAGGEAEEKRRREGGGEVRGWRRSTGREGVGGATGGGPAPDARTLLGKEARAVGAGPTPGARDVGGSERRLVGKGGVMRVGRGVCPAAAAKNLRSVEKEGRVVRVG